MPLSHVLELLSGHDWLWFYESAIEAAMHAWATAGAENAELAELSRSFLLRRKTFICAELGNVTMEKALRLSAGLNSAGREGIDWLLDDPKFTSYKASSSVVARLGADRGPQKGAEDGAYP